MPLTSIVSAAEKAATDFPALVVNVNTGAVVLATSSSPGGSLCGVLVGYVPKPAGAPMPPRQQIGHHQTNWDRTAFREYDGSVTLSNEE